MRITGGRFRGRVLQPPKDGRVRPTSDKVRQAVFNLLAHHDFDESFTLEGVRVIDLFAGTGALGIEALSRGAVFSLFVDNHAESRALIRRNVEALGLTGATKVWRRDATALGPMPEGAGGPFELVFLDPPYRELRIPDALVGLVHGNWLEPSAIVVAESAKDEKLVRTTGFELCLERSYGDTRIGVMRLAPP